MSASIPPSWRAGYTRAFGRGPRPNWETISAGPLAGRQLLLDGRVPAWRQVIEGNFEPWLYEAASHARVLDGATVWDVGAHMGYHTLAFAVLVGDQGRVIAFEPNAANIERIYANLARNEDLRGRITVIDRALADRDAEAPFLATASVDGTSSGSHLASVEGPGDPAAYLRFRETTVATAKVDTLIAHGVAVPTLLKIDVEGAEVLVLEGARRLLQDVRPVLLIEIHHIATMFSANRLLDELNYELELGEAEGGSSERAFLIARPRA